MQIRSRMVHLPLLNITIKTVRSPQIVHKTTFRDKNNAAWVVSNGAELRNYIKWRPRANTHKKALAHLCARVKRGARCALVAGAGFEPTTFGLWARRATELLHPAIFVPFKGTGLLYHIVAALSRAFFNFLRLPLLCRSFSAFSALSVPAAALCSAFALSVLCPHSYGRMWKINGKCRAYLSKKYIDIVLVIMYT